MVYWSNAVHDTSGNPDRDCHSGPNQQKKGVQAKYQVHCGISFVQRYSVNFNLFINFVPFEIPSNLA